MKILLVEDDGQIAANLKVLLEREKYIVDVATTVEEGSEAVTSGDYDMIICDRRLPDGDGIEVIRIAHLHLESIPCLMLTAKNTKEDVVMGLDAGADDYLAKPFDSVVLLARIRALMRRRKKVLTLPTTVIDNVTIDLNTRQVMVKNKVVALSPKEYGVLEYLISNRGKIVERVDILTHVWDEEIDLFSNTVDVHVRYLRKKLGNKLIETIRGKGYVVWEK